MSDENELLLKARREQARKALERIFGTFDLDYVRDEEIIAAMLMVSAPQLDPYQGTMRLLGRFGDLDIINRTTKGYLSAALDVPYGQASTMKSLKNLTHRTKRPIDMETDLADVGIMKSVMRDYFGRDLMRETAMIATITEEGKMLLMEDIPKGKPSQMGMDLDWVVELIRNSGACACVAAHYHPYKVLRISEEDKRQTRLLLNVLNPAGFELIDHFIVDGIEAISMREVGALTILD